MAATLLWSHSVAQNFYVREIGNVVTGPINGVKSCDALDVDNYDNDNYRDEFFDPGNNSSNITLDNVGGISTANGFVTKTTEAGVDTVATIGGPSPGVSIVSVTDAALHIPPRPEAKKRTQIRFWSETNGAAGTGSVLYCGWADAIISYSPSQHTFI